jgi:hypothetical protein
MPYRGRMMLPYVAWIAIWQAMYEPRASESGAGSSPANARKNERLARSQLRPASHLRRTDLSMLLRGSASKTAVRPLSGRSLPAQDRALQADLEDALGDLLRLFGVERRAPFHRHVDGGDRERLGLHHSGNPVFVCSLQSDPSPCSRRLITRSPRRRRRRLAAPSASVLLRLIPSLSAQLMSAFEPSHPQRRETGRSPSHPTYNLRNGHQLENRKSTRTRRTTHSSRARRRSDRIATVIRGSQCPHCNRLSRVRRMTEFDPYRAPLHRSTLTTSRFDNNVAPAPGSSGFVGQVVVRWGVVGSGHAALLL